jgi:hypothetical protein
VLTDNFYWMIQSYINRYICFGFFYVKVKFFPVPKHSVKKAYWGREWKVSYILNLLLSTVTGWYRTKRPMQLRPLSDVSYYLLSSNHSRFIHQNSLLWLQQKHLVAKRGEIWRKCTWILPISISVYTSRVLQHAVKSYDMGPSDLLPIRRKSYCGFVSPLNIHRSRPSFYPWTLGPMSSTITIAPPRTS